MKKILLTILSCFTIQALAQAQNLQSQGSVKTWVDEGKKIVYFLPNPVLTVHGFELNSGDADFWAQLSVGLSYAEINPESAARIKAIQTDYPGYTLSRAMITGKGNIHVTIPSLGINEDVPSMPGVEGPYINQTYYVKETNAATFKREFSQPGFISVEGKISYSKLVTKQLEYEELESGACQSLFSGGDTFQAVLQRYAELTQRIDHMPLAYPSTKEGLKNSVLVNCLSFSSATGVRSFEELLASKLSLNQTPERIFGQTLGQAMEQQVESFQPYQVMEMKK